jgi:hypothetical protein
MFLELLESRIKKQKKIRENCDENVVSEINKKELVLSL